MEIEFHPSKPYTCPTCGRRTTIKPCVTCAAMKHGSSGIVADLLLVEAGRRAERIDHLATVVGMVEIER